MQERRSSQSVSEGRRLANGSCLCAIRTTRTGLWLDDDFMHGSSGPTQTFNNDGLASSPDFKIDGLEVWSFVEQEF